MLEATADRDHTITGPDNGTLKCPIVMGPKQGNTTQLGLPVSYKVCSFCRHRDSHLNEFLASYKFVGHQTTNSADSFGNRQQCGDFMADTRRPGYKLRKELQIQTSEHRKLHLLQ